MLRSLDEQINDPATDMRAFARSLVDGKADGCIKLYLIARILRLRREQPALFAEGSYTPLEAQGARAENVIAFARRHGDVEILVVAPRLVTRLSGDNAAPVGAVWGDDLLLLPDAEPNTSYTQLLTQQAIGISEQDGKRGLPLAAVFADLPVALLIKEAAHDQNLAR
jgi:(1->4)-alpha-D-glucan 1-alpha-D-glucosylmutase